MHGPHQPAPTGNEHHRIDSWRNAEELHARLHPDVAGPAAKRAILCAISNAVDLSLRAARRLLGDEALVAAPTRLMHVGKRHEITLFELAPIDVGDRAANGREMSGGDVSPEQSDRARPRDARGAGERPFRIPRNTACTASHCPCRARARATRALRCADWAPAITAARTVWLTSRRVQTPPASTWCRPPSRSRRTACRPACDRSSDWHRRPARDRVPRASCPSSNRARTARGRRP